ncbi:MAG: hypothetical protein OZ928_20405 [Polyangiaceae bacterium]|nr:hypothetical protein [Polyangiaceae bacterium]
MSSDQKEQLTLRALGLLNEQVQARIVHYKGDLETNTELDAITAQVVAQLKQMQEVAAQEAHIAHTPDEIEHQQVATMTRLLKRAFADTGSPLSTPIIKTVGKRIAKLFFESELHEKTKGDKERTIHHPEQGVYYVLGRYKNRLRAELEGFEYEGEAVRAATLELLVKIERDLQVAFLSRRSPELNRVMTIFTGVLFEFLQQHIPPRAEAMARNTVRAARTARRANSVAYKVQADCFPEFRGEWERLLMQMMVNFCGDELLARLTSDSEHFQEETVRFFTDPHIFSDTGEVICDALYDFLCLEGFLDLPVDWRVRLARDS